MRPLYLRQRVKITHMTGQSSNSKPKPKPNPKTPKPASTDAGVCSKNTWRHKDAKDMLMQLCDQIGDPDVFDGVQDGIAIWRGDKLDPACAHEITLRDESVKHRCPEPHHDFLYTTVKAHVPPDKVHDVLDLSGSVNYDPLKKELTARCGSLEANLATLHLATNIATGKVDRETVQKDGLYKKHIQSISCSASEDPECGRHLDTLRADICSNIQKLKPSDPPLDYYKNAFNADCGKPERRWEAIP